MLEIINPAVISGTLAVVLFVGILAALARYSADHAYEERQDTVGVRVSDLDRC